MQSSNFFKTLAYKVIKTYKNQIWNEAKDVTGAKFKRYTSKTYEQRKNAGKLKRQASESKGKTAPIVTGDFKNDFKLMNVSSTGFTLGWAAHGAKVNYLANNKRYVTKANQPMPEKILNDIDKSIKKETERQIPKDKVIHIKVGK